MAMCLINFKLKKERGLNRQSAFLYLVRCIVQKIELSEPNTYLSDEVEIITVLNSTNYLIIK